MPTTNNHSVPSIAAELHGAIGQMMPFARSESRTYFLVPPLPGIPDDLQRAALEHLASLGALTDYRYIDAEPQPAILVVSA